MDVSVDERLELPSKMLIPLVRHLLEECLETASCTSLPEEMQGKYRRRLKAYCCYLYDDFVRVTIPKVPMERTTKRGGPPAIRYPEAPGPIDAALQEDRDIAARQLVVALSVSRSRERALAQSFEKSLEDAPESEVYPETPTVDMAREMRESIRMLKFELERKEEALRSLKKSQCVPQLKPESLTELQVSAFLYQAMFCN